ncbi:MAG: sigma-70 family RNA polymerase sigma factor [Anaerolineae bacterium]|nr:sigma-70 family RNA polymerase sigma factor [Anaerolineae bacterium]
MVSQTGRPPLRQEVQDGVQPPAVVGDRRWFELLKKLDDDAWDSLIGKFALRLYEDIQASLLARSSFYHDLDAICKDVAQKTWLTAMKRIGVLEWQGEEHLYHWLRVIAYFHVRNYVRRHKPETYLDELDDQELDHFIHDHRLYGDNPESEALRQERMLVFNQALRELDARDREIFMRRVVLGEKPRELALRYGLKPETVSQILFRAKQKLQNSLILNHLFHNTGK